MDKEKEEIERRKKEDLEEKRKSEEEKKLKELEEERKRKVEEERKRKVEEERRRKEEEEKRKKEEEERRRKEEEEKRRKEEEERRNRRRREGEIIPHTMINFNNNNRIRLNNNNSNNNEERIGPIKKEILRFLPCNKLKDIRKLNEEQKKCLICCQNYKNHDITMTLPCFHFYHKECIIKWLRKKASCPLCKIDINNYAIHNDFN